MIDLRYPVITLANELNKTHQGIHKFCKENGIELDIGKNRAYFSPQSLRAYLQKFGFNYPKSTIAFQACKGGVGKTSLCYNIATRAAQYGSKVLAIDMDMQAHLTMALLGDKEPNFPVWQDILRGALVENAIMEIHPHLHLLPSNLNNSYLEKQISSSHKIVYSAYVKDHLKKIKNNYDFIFIDCAPALSHINTAIAVAADKIFIPVNPDVFSFDGVEKTLSELKEIQHDFQTDIDAMIILNRFDGREKNSLNIIADLKNQYGPLMCEYFVVASSEIKNSIAQRQLLFNNKKAAKVASDIDAIVKMMINLEVVGNAKTI